MRKRRQHSLRRHVWRVVLLVALVPLLFITLGIPFDYLVQWRLQSRAREAVSDCADRIRAGGDCEAVAHSTDAWLRVFRDGAPVEDYDAASEASVSWLEKMMEPESVEWLRRYDPVSEAAPAGLDARSRCRIMAFDRLLQCTEARSIQVDDRHLRLVATTGDVRSVRALSPDGVTKLALQVLLVALIVGWWLGRRIVRPMEQLRDRVLARRSSEQIEPILTDDETEVGEVAAAFNELLSELEERRRANEAFAADLAHDLKTPIATVLSSAENLESSSDLSEEAVQRHAAVLKRSGERLNRVVGEFLDLARAEAGLEQVQRERVDVIALLDSVIRESTSDTTSDRVELRAPAPADVRGSPRYLQMAFANVIENALQVTEADQHVEVVVAPDVGRVVVSIRDEGPGIAPDDLPRVFDRFFTRRSGGTGLGLSFAQAVARAHDGHLEVTSVRGSGATFQFDLPSYESHTEMTQE